MDRFFEQALNPILRELKDVKRLLNDGGRPSVPSVDSPRVPGRARRMSFGTTDGRGIRKPSNAQLYAMLRAPKDTSTTAATPESRVVASLKKHVSEVSHLRRELAVMRQMYKSFQEDTAGLMTELASQLTVVRSQVQPTPALARQTLLSAKAKMEQQAKSLAIRMHEFQDMVEEQKIDLTHRRCRPSSARLEFLLNEAQALQMEVSDFGEFVEEVRPTWKKVWEDELQGIVKEQNFLKKQEGLAQELEDDYAAAMEVLGALQQLQQLLIQQNEVRPPLLDVLSAEEVESEGLKGVLQEVRLAVSTNDSERRLRAFEKFEKQRKWELQNQVNPFQAELNTFFRDSKLKLTGGVQEIERQRQNKNRELFKALFSV
ncbi:Bud site selection protein 6 [Quaeritorhiza haematococci]|nr:Bud site selection protein 6 [Quaeritorhiza haematococci]